MFFYSTIFPSTLQLLKDLQALEDLKSFYLVGGTALALQIGHRISIDLEMFSQGGESISLIPDLIQHLGRIKITNQSKAVINLFVDDIKVDFVKYRYELINPPILEDDLVLASIEDIAAMKLAAITGRGSKKDFVDLYFILQKYSLLDIFEFYRSKFPDGSDFMVYKSLSYFEDAEIEPMPRMIKEVTWNDVKSRIISEVRAHFP